MSIDIERYINFLLYKKGVISLDGIGTISQVREPAYFSAGKKEIFPPKTRYKFSESIEDSNILVNTIQQNERITTDSAQHYVRKYCQSILNILVNYDIAKVGEIGFLEIQNENTIFIPSEKSLSKSYYGLPAIHLKQLDKKVIANTDQELPTVSILKEKKKDKYEWLNYLGALILGGIMVVAYHYFLDPLPSMSNHKSKDISTAAAVNKEIDPEQKTAPLISEEERSAEEFVPSDGTSEQGSEDAESYEDTSSVILAKPKEDTECIIIVGVFNKTISAMNLIDRLKSDGYTHYIDDHFDTQRVGVRFKCTNHDPDEMIKTIRRKYNSKAWYLVPQVSI